MAAAIQRVAKTVDQMNELPFSEKQVLYYCFTLPLLITVMPMTDTEQLHQDFYAGLQRTAETL
jgi:hypothetical protein